MTEYEMTPPEIEYLQRHPHDSINSYLIDDDFSLDIREMLMTLEMPESPESGRLLDLRRCLIALRSLDRDALTQMRLDYSLCPLHACDYAICFDDDDDECAMIRLIHPSHDT